MVREGTTLHHRSKGNAKKKKERARVEKKVFLRKDAWDRGRARRGLL